MKTGRNFSMPGINSGRWNQTMLNLWWPFWKWWPVEIFQCRESIRDIIIYPHIKFWWYRTMLNFWGIVTAILKMATGRNFSMSGHHYLPIYQILMISDNVEFLPPIFYAVFWQPFWKWQTPWKFWKCRIAPLMVRAIPEKSVSWGQNPSRVLSTFLYRSFLFLFIFSGQ
jgi:hypothetical protein